MPIREYTCSECGCEFESIELGSASEHHPKDTGCPLCGSHEVGRRFSVFSRPRGEAPASCHTGPAPGRFG